MQGYSEVTPLNIDRFQLAGAVKGALLSVYNTDIFASYVYGNMVHVFSFSVRARFVQCIVVVIMTSPQTLHLPRLHPVAATWRSMPCLTSCRNWRCNRGCGLGMGGLASKLLAMCTIPSSILHPQPLAELKARVLSA